MAVLFGSIHAALAMLLFGYPLKGALLAAVIAGPLFAISMHVLSRTKHGTMRHER